MLIEYEFTRKLLLVTLESAPGTLAQLLQGVNDEEADYRPDPERFTIREAVAHLARIETVFNERLHRIRAETLPTLDNFDEARDAVDRNYAQANLNEQLRLYATGRAETTAFARSLGSEEWQRRGRRPEIGELTCEALVVLLTLHDAYHVRQVVAWRKAFAALPE